MTSINNVGVAEWLRQQSAKLFYVGSNPITHSIGKVNEKL